MPVEFGEGLTQNKQHQIQILDLSSNTISSNALVPLAMALRSFTHKLRVLNFYDCGLASRGIAALVHAFRGNWGLSLGLEELNFGKNKLDAEVTNIFCEWITLMKANCQLKRLSLADSGADGTPLVLALKNTVPDPSRLASTGTCTNHLIRRSTLNFLTFLVFDYRRCHRSTSQTLALR